MLLLGDRVYSNTSVKSYMKQLLEVYESSRQLMMVLDEIVVDRTMYYGASRFTESRSGGCRIGHRRRASGGIYKDATECAEPQNEAQFYCVFEQYVRMLQTFELLWRNIREG